MKRDRIILIRELCSAEPGRSPVRSWVEGCLTFIELGKSYKDILTIKDMKKGRKIEKINRLNDNLSVLVFLAASYISFNSDVNFVLFNTLGVLFFAAMLLGVVCIYKKAKFIF